MNAGTLKCARALGLSCETPAASGPPGLHTTTRELQTYTFDGPGASNTTKIPREDPQRGKKRTNFAAGEGKNCRSDSRIVNSWSVKKKKSRAVRPEVVEFATRHDRGWWCLARCWESILSSARFARGFRASNRNSRVGLIASP